MARAGESVENPVMGDRVIFQKTARDTRGELLRFDHFLKVGGHGPEEHIHPRQEERFEVISGTMGVRANGRDHTLHAGETITVLPGTPHCWWNAGDVELHQITEFRPALRFEVFLETIAALGREEQVYKGWPLALQFAVLANECKGNVYVTRAPVPLQRIAYQLALAPLGKLFGYHARYLRYADIGMPGEAAASAVHSPAQSAE